MATATLPGISARSARLTCLVRRRPRYMFTCGSVRHGDVNDIIYDAEGACEGQYGCTLWQTVETQMKCCRMWHFIRFCTACSDININCVR